MNDFVALLLIGALAAAYLATVWLSTDSKAIRFWAIWAVAGSVALGIGAFLTTGCNIAENASELFRERCEGSIPRIPLYAIPPLLAVPFLRRFVPGGLVLMVGGLLVAVAIVIPLQLLAV